MPHTTANLAQSFKIFHSIHSAENQFTYNGLKFHMQFSKYRVSLLTDTTEHRFYTNLFQPIAYPV